MQSAMCLRVSPAKDKRNAKSIKLPSPQAVGKAALSSSDFIARRNKGAAREERRRRDKGPKRMRFLMHNKQWRKKTPRRIRRRKGKADKLKKLEEELRGARADVVMAQAALAGVEAARGRELAWWHSQEAAAARTSAGKIDAVPHGPNNTRLSQVVSPLTMYSGCMAEVLQITEGWVRSEGVPVTGGKDLEALCAERSAIAAALADCITAEDRAALWSISGLTFLVDDACVSSSDVCRSDSSVAKPTSQPAHGQPDEFRNEVEQRRGKSMCEAREEIDEVHPVVSSSASQSIKGNSITRAAAPPKASDLNSSAAGSSNASNTIRATNFSKASTADSAGSSSIAMKFTTSINSSLEMKLISSGSTSNIHSIAETNFPHVIGNPKGLFDDEGNPYNDDGHPYGEVHPYNYRGHSQAQAHSSDKICRYSDRSNGFPHVEDESCHAPGKSISSPEIADKACHSSEGSEASPQIKDEACHSLSGSGAYSEGEGHEVVLLSTEMGHPPDHSNDDESIDESMATPKATSVASSMASTIRTRLTLISASDIPAAKELQPLGGPKYYVATNTRSRQAKIIHEAMPRGYDPGIGGPSEEKGYEVLEYRLVENEGKEPIILGLECLPPSPPPEETSDDASSSSCHTPQIESTFLTYSNGLSFSIFVPGLPAEGDDDIDCDESVASHRTSTNGFTGYTTSNGKMTRLKKDTNTQCDAFIENGEDKSTTASLCSSGSGDLAEGPEKIDSDVSATDSRHTSGTGGIRATRAGSSQVPIMTELIKNHDDDTVSSYHTAKTRSTSIAGASGISRANSILSKGIQYAMEGACCGGSFCGLEFYIVLS